jgi:nicotinate phosphoribosyltransferase
MKGLYTDLYEVRMAAGYRRRRMVGPATFSLSVRRLPARRGFLVAAGLADVMDFLEHFCIDDDELSYLHQAAELDAESLGLLRGLRFTGDVWAVPEGRVVLAGEPLLEITADAAEAQIVETAVVNLITFQTTVATKAARCRIAAGTTQLIDFSMRRTHGLEAAMSSARAARIAGFDATSNLEAARRYGLRAVGTMGHSFVQAFADERAAFRAFAADYPDAPVFLVDTYDTVAGVRATIDVIRQMGLTGPAGIRIDSGDLRALAARARGLLDQAGLTNVRILASGGLDEYRIADLMALGAPIDAFGVGTRMGTSSDASSLDSAYHLVAVGNRPVAKSSAGRALHPGPKQVFRHPAGASTDILAVRGEQPPDDSAPLLEPVMREGVRLRPADPALEVQEAMRRCAADLHRLPPDALSVTDPVAPVATVSPRLAALQEELTAMYRRGRNGTPWR